MFTMDIYVYIYKCCCVKLLQLCLTLCDPMDCSPPGSSVDRILQARILEWVVISLLKPYSLSVQFSCSVGSTLCDPMDCSTPSLPVHHQLPEFTQTHVC